MSFEEFVLEHQPRAGWFYSVSQSEFLAPVRLDGIVRFDRLEEDLHRLPPIVAALGAGDPLEPLHRLNETRHPPWQELCTPRLFSIAEAANPGPNSPIPPGVLLLVQERRRESPGRFQIRFPPIPRRQSQ